MKTLKITLTTLLIFSMVGCGGSGLSNTDITNISTALMKAFSDAGSGFTPKIAINPKTVTTPINMETACPVAGRITSTGNLIATLSDDESSTFEGMNGLITFHVSDPTNNLNDCDVGSGVILDGTIILTMTMTSSYVMTGSLVGTIGINKRGPTGGLTPISDDCGIFLSFTQTAVTGTICGQTVK